MKNEYWEVMVKNSEDDPYWGTSNKISSRKLADDIYDENVEKFKFIKMIHVVIKEEIVRSNFMDYGNETD